MSDKILVFGHQKPDTDAIGSSYGFSYLSNHRPNGALNTEVVA
ncbi:MAG: manganese-dependent inorganic pyrophosphatase, partial [Lactococcus lactis]